MPRITPWFWFYLALGVVALIVAVTYAIDKYVRPQDELDPKDDESWFV